MTKRTSTSTSTKATSTKATSYYVKRERPDDQPAPPYGRTSWTGPIRSERQAGREAAAWRAEGWRAYVMPTCPLVRREVRTWERAKRAAAAR